MTDKTGREIKVGDVLKMFHFSHYIRKRKVYMYKLVVEIDGYLWGLNISEIAKKGTEEAHKFLLEINSAWNDIEIMDSLYEGSELTDWYDRPKEKKNDITV